jgi:hypothetical protein
VTGAGYGEGRSRRSSWPPCSSLWAYGAWRRRTGQPSPSSISPSIRPPHTVSDAGEFNSGLLAPGAIFTLTFNEPGNYPYFCKIHPDTMVGTVIVTGASAAPPPAPQVEPASAPETPPAVSPELAGVGVGTMAVAQTGTQALLAAIAAAACALAALVSYRRV